MSKSGREIAAINFNGNPGGAAPVFRDSLTLEPAFAINPEGITVDRRGHIYVLSTGLGWQNIFHEFRPSPAVPNQRPLVILNRPDPFDVFDDDENDSEFVSIGALHILDPDGTILNYTWIINGVPSFAGFGPDIMPFEQTLAAGSYSVELQFRDDGGATNQAGITLNIFDRPNQAPVLEVNVPSSAELAERTDQTVSVRADLTGSNDPDGSPLRFQFEIKAINFLLQSQSLITNLSLPPGLHSLEITALDIQNKSTTVTRQINITRPANQPPTINAGDDVTVQDSDGTGSETIRILLQASDDADGTIFEYIWYEGFVLDGATELARTQTPWADLDFTVGSHPVIVVAVDNDGGFASDFLTVTVQAGPPPPIAPGPSTTGQSLNYIHPDSTQQEAEIAYTVHSPGEVVLHIFDENLRPVTVINAGFKSVGPTSTKWNCTRQDGAQVFSGQYRIRIQGAVSPKEDTVVVER